MLRKSGIHTVAKGKEKILKNAFISYITFMEGTMTTDTYNTEIIRNKVQQTRVYFWGL